MEATSSLYSGSYRYILKRDEEEGRYGKSCDYDRAHDETHVKCSASSVII